MNNTDSNRPEIKNNKLPRPITIFDLNKGMSDEFRRSLKLESSNLELTRNSKLSFQAVTKIFSRFEKDQKCNSPNSQENKERIAAVLASLCQQGGTLKGCDGELTIFLFEKTIKLKTVKSSLSLIEHKGDLRKLARTLAQDFYEILSQLEIDGNLSKKIDLLFPNETFSAEERIWLSDFQIENPNLPKRLKKFIMESFKAKSPSPSKRKTGK